jgi:hypothetical protein
MQQAQAPATRARSRQLARARAYIGLLVREGRLSASEAAEQLQVVDWAQQTGRSVLVVTDLEPRAAARGRDHAA